MDRSSSHQSIVFISVSNDWSLWQGAQKNPDKHRGSMQTPPGSQQVFNLVGGESAKRCVMAFSVFENICCFLSVQPDEESPPTPTPDCEF